VIFSTIFTNCKILGLFTSSLSKLLFDIEQLSYILRLEDSNTLKELVLPKSIETYNKFSKYSKYVQTNSVKLMI